MTITRPQGLWVTETRLTCSGLHDIAPELAEAIRDWMHAHGLDEKRVLAGEPIVRDPERGTLTSTQRPNGVPEPMVVVDLAPPDAERPWPAPFPLILLQQQKPTHCLACGHELDPDGA